MYKSKSVVYRNEKVSTTRYIGNVFFTDLEYKNDLNAVNLDDSKFARQLKKLVKDEEEEKKSLTLANLKEYLDKQDNLKFILKLGKPSFSILLKSICDLYQNEHKKLVAECLGKIGACLAIENDSRYIDWILEKISTVSLGNSNIDRENDIKSYLVESINESLRSENFTRFMKDHVDKLLNILKKLLESDSSSMMMVVSRAIITISHIYQDSVLNVFQDVVDILVAWHIDKTQPSDVINFTSKVLVDLRACWLKDIEFTILLLNQFLEDLESYMNNYSDQLENNENEKLENYEKIDKMSALIKVYNTVIKSISCIDDRNFPSLNSILNNVDREKISESFRRLIVCVGRINNVSYNELLYAPCNYCVELHFDIFGEYLNIFSDQIIAYFQKQNQNSKIWSNECDLSFLSLIAKISSLFINKVNIEFFKNLVAYETRFWSYKFSANKNVVQESLNIYKTLILLKSIPIVQEIYKSILIDFELSYNVILKESNSSETCSLQETNSSEKQTKLMNIKQAEICFIFNLCILAELGNSKNNLICMYALSPSLFEILTTKLAACNWNVAENFPNIQYATLNTLYSYCSRHDHFILSSSVLANKSSSDTIIFTNQHTRDYFKIIVELLTQVISNQSCSNDISILTLSWLLEIVDILSADHVSVFKSKLFSKLYSNVITTAYSDEEEVCLLCNKILLKTLQKFINLNESTLIRILDLCKYSMMNISETIHENYVKLLAYIPVNILTCSNLDFNHFLQTDFTVFSRAGRINFINSCNYNSTFSIHHFKAVMGYILAGSTQNEIYSKTWLERLFYSCQRNEKLKDAKLTETTLDSVIENHEGLLWFWALWESSQFFVQSKLKTPLGKPQDTFLAIESALKGYFSNSNATTTTTTTTPGEAQTPPQQINSKDSTQKPNTDDWYMDLSRVTLLVQFIEYLEKNIYNAYEGTAVSIAQPTLKAIKIFFRTNKSTCIDWFSRVRYFIIHIAVKSGHYEISIRQSYEYIQNAIKHNLTQTPEFEQVVIYLVKSLIKLRNWPTLHGLYIYLNQTLKKRFSWIKASIEEAHGKLENAANEYKRFIKSGLSVDASPLETSHDKGPLADKQMISFGLARFLNDRILESYSQLHEWKEYLQWNEEYKNILQNKQDISDEAKQALESKIDANYLRSLSSFESLDSDSSKSYQRKSIGASNIQSLDELMSSISCKYDIEEIENAITKEIFKTTLSKKSSILSLDMAQKLSSTLLRILNMDEMSTWNSERVVLAQLSHISQSEQFDLPFVKTMKFDPEKHNIKAMNHLLFITQNRQNVKELTSDRFELLNDFTLSISHLARKQMNYNLASKLLTRIIYNQANSKYLYNKASNIYELVTIFFEQQQVQQHQIPTCKYLMNCIEIGTEVSKLLYSTDASNKENSIEILVKGISRYADTLLCYPTAPLLLNNELLNENCARSILTLHKWFNTHLNVLKDVTQVDTNSHGTIGEKSYLINSFLKKVLSLKYSGCFNRQPNLDLNLINNSTASSTNAAKLLSDNDIITGDLIDLATIMCPKLAKSWYTLANWCYKWGKKSVTKAHSAVTILNDEEYLKLISILPNDLTSNEKEYAISILSKLNSKELNLNDEDIDQSLYNDSVDLTRCLLFTKCKNLSLACIENLIELWRNIINRIYYYHKVACRSYFVYLKLNSNDNDKKVYEDGNISATLRIVKLLVKYAKELKDDLQEGLAETPTEPWKGIIPQLFCRLNHPEIYVRHSISQLLCRVARDFPHLIVYPAVVGSTDGPTKIESMQSKSEKKLFDKTKSNASSQQSPQQNQFEYPENVDDDYQSNITGVVEDNQNEANNEEDDADEEAEDDDEGNADEEKKVELQNSYKHLLDTLSETNLKMISEVKLFLNEMRRITLLREELWLGTLNQIHGDINKRMEQLTSEINKVNNNSSLNEEEKNSIIKEKYEILLAPIVSVLEYVYEITKLPAETPNEENFVNDFTNQIKNALVQLKNINNSYKPWNGWSLFKQLHHLLYQRSQRKNLNTLFLEQISPKLSAIKSSMIPIPGEDGQYCTIYSIAPTIQILPTKTKPKKLFFIGSNGKRYPYLFKGLEDLHLDERIMQLLSIVNAMFGKVNKSEFPRYHALNYSVTPLGPRSGLISWVDGSTPLFSLYKKWQQRELVHLTNKQQQQQQLGGGSGTAVPLQILRPNELYYNKLNSIVKEKGLKTSTNRNDYPLNILRQVLEELIKETPNDLLSKELWCCAPTPGSWWNSLQTYSRSTAVMSMIGYIIGLGDRHLDNLLLNLQTGEVAHIDYNICFEKGQNLRIPEKVPFRLTQNLLNALGITGIEGMFRLSCEQVMKVLRKGRETLLTLLEAFVYDPLLDWTGNDTGIIASFYGGSNINTNNIKQTKELKRDLDKKITYRLYSIRLLENKALASKNSERFLQLTLNLDSKINSLIELVDKQSFKEKIITLYEQAKEYLENSLKESTHYLYTLHDRYNDCMQFKTNMDKIQVIGVELYTQYEKWTQSHVKSIEYLKSDEINELMSRFMNNSIAYTCDDSAYQISAEFLQQIGQIQQFQSCEAYEKDLQYVIKDIYKTHLRQFLTLFSTLIKVFNWLPQTIYKTSKHYNWLNWLKELKQENFSKEKCIEIINNFKSLNNYELNLLPMFGAHEYIENESLVLGKLDTIKNEYQTVKSSLDQLVSRKQQLPLEFETLEMQFQAAKSELAHLVSNCSPTMRISLIVSLKCETLKLIFKNLCKWNIMENASLQAKQQLVTLTSKDGDWFLDEMISLITNCNSIVNLYAEYLNSDDSETYLNYVNIIHNLTNVFLNLKNLLFQYQKNIFSSLLKYSIINDEDFRYCYSELEALKIEEFFYLIDRNNFEENFSLDSECSRKLNEIKFKFNQLLSSKSNKTCLLLAELDKFFNKIDFEFEKCIKFVKDYQYFFNESLAKLQINDNMANTTHFFDDRIHLWYKNIFLIKKYHTIYLCLSLCDQYGVQCYDIRNSESTFFSHEQFLLPIKTFISEYIIHMLVGVPTTILNYAILNLMNYSEQDNNLNSETINSFINEQIVSNEINEYDMNMVGDLITKYDTIWSNIDIYTRIDSNISLSDSNLSIIHTVMISFEWLYDAFISKHLQKDSYRKTVLNEMEKIQVKLKEFESKSSNALEKLNSAEVNILKRLEWALPSTPALVDVIKVFEIQRQRRNEFFKTEAQACEKLKTMLSSLVQFEKLRTKSYFLLNEESKFEELLENIDKFVLIYEKKSEINEVELALMNFKSFKEKKTITASIIKDYLKSLHEETVITKRAKIKDDKDCLTRIEDLNSNITELKIVLNQHNKVMNDIKPLLKAMNRYGDNDKLKTYTDTYREFSENCQILIRSLSNDSLNRNKLEEIQSSLTSLKAIIPKIYPDLDNINAEMNRIVTLELTKSEEKKKLYSNSGVINSKPHKAVQECNDYAVSVWRRVNQKLDGKDPDPNKNLSVEEQVDFCIKEAIDLNNLATLYEGWTPWI